MNDNVDKIENEYTKMWKRISSFSPELQEIYWENWDETGRPKYEDSPNRIIIALLNKNASSGFIGFKLDMNTIFEKENLRNDQIVMYYNIFIAGAKYITDRLVADSSKEISSTSSKPKL